MLLRGPCLINAGNWQLQQYFLSIRLTQQPQSVYKYFLTLNFLPSL